MLNSKAGKIIILLNLIMLIRGISYGQAGSGIPKQSTKLEQGTKPVETKPVTAKPATLLSTATFLDTNGVAPEEKSVNWYYERAVVYYLREQSGRATIELYKAQEKDPENVNVNYLLGILFKERKLWKEAADAFFKVTQVSKIEHVPARLELALASVEQGNYQIAFLNLEKVINLMKLDKDFQSRLYQYKVDASTEKDIGNVKKKLKMDVKTSLENFIGELFEILSDSSESYSGFTIALGLDEPLVYNELAQLYDEDETENDNKTLEALVGFLKKRNGFSPLLLAQIGAIYQKQNRASEAISVYERVVKQLISLGFSEKAGDFSTEEIQTLKTKPQKTVPEQTTPAKKAAK